MAPEVKSSILAKLKKLEESVEKLEALRKTPFERFLNSFQIQDASMYNLVIGIEAITDVGNYFLAEHFHKSPETYEDIITQLGETKIISEELFQKSKGMARFRNLLIHLYEVVEPEQVHESLQKAPGIFREFAAAFSEFLEKTTSSSA